MIFTTLSSNSLIMRISWFVIVFNTQWDYPGGASGKEPTCQCRRRKKCMFHPWVRKIWWRRKWQPTPVFLLGESPWTEEPGGLQSTGSHRVRHSWVTFNSLHFRSLSSVLWSTALVSKLPKWFRPPSPVWQLLPSSKKQKKSQRTKNSYEMERL